MAESFGASSEGDAGAKSKQSFSTLDVVSELVAIAKEGMRDSPPILRGIIALAVIGAIGAFVAGMALIPRQDPVLAMVLIVTSLLVLAFGMFLLTKVFMQQKATRQARWSRFVPDTNAVLARADDFRMHLERIRAYVAAALRAIEGCDDISDQSIRANMFLADYTRVGEGIACELYMPREFRINMLAPPEWRIRFLPGKGASGDAFVSGDQTIERSDFNLDDRTQLEALDPDLSMILSMPLVHPDDRYAMAVANLDVLETDRSHDDLRRALAQVSDDADLRSMIDQLAAEFARLPRVEISIFAERVDPTSTDAK